MQNDAINHYIGSALVLAGPGTGKTYTLTNRIYKLIEKYHVDSSSILVVTFTRAAAKEMKERFIKLCKNTPEFNFNQVKFGTFHSIFFEILRESFGYNNNSLIKYNEKIMYLKEAIEYLYKNKKLPKEYINLNLDSINDYLNKIIYLKNNSYKNKLKKNKYDDAILSYYIKKCKNKKKIDFDDMAILLYDYLLKNKEVLSYYQNKYKFLLIDEFQDISLIQYKLIKMIVSSKNIFVVGDDDQSIYNFRDVNPHIMKDFLKDYPDSKIYNLNMNYRSAPIIIYYTSNIIKYNKNRFKKDILPYNKTKGFLEIKQFESSQIENSYVLDIINNNTKIGLPYKEMAILYRTNTIPIAIIDLLRKYDIPFFIKDKITNIFDTFYFKDLISYAKIIYNIHSINDFFRVANKPLRYITRESIRESLGNINKLINYYKLTPYMNNILIEFREKINFARNLPLASCFHYIRTILKYDDYLLKYCKELNLDFDEINNNLNVYEEESLSYKTLNEFLEYIDNYNQNLYEIHTSNEKNSINLMTFHSSKGLEFYDVQILDAMDGIIPHKKAKNKEDIENERRLFYVACTRAKHNLHIYFTNIRYAKSYNKSRFIEESLL
ncbi:MAG: ATP-dependent helicase [Eubacteriales bacterium]|nr:ATP-dependent helicase [Eubacteriales bacterium]